MPLPPVPEPGPDLVVHHVPSAVAAIYRPRLSLLGIVLVAWLGVGVGLVVTGHPVVGAALLVASLVVFVMFVETLRGWLSRSGAGPALVIGAAGIEIGKPPLRLAWHALRAVEVLAGRGWLRTPTLVLRLRPGVTGGSAGALPGHHSRARWRRWQERGVLIDATALDAPMHTIVAAVAHASRGSVEVPTTGLR
ncbi:hypothetical protein EXU48_13765 [Occultella glacieicola]|uniref:Uncharacterized protein n=1 Tax=Occultella glacieicola TaxID=2518684 RepID=A0ABY2E1Y4_9MICO|nr:hypothetical protein [Occultella glacieicola]TDE92607.1 hypothetical protein EXU48_13765 [Occultella glacieicola]